MSMKTYAAKHVLGMRGISMKPAEFNRVAAAAGVDVAEALGYKEPALAVRTHCKGGAKYPPLQTAGGMQEVRVIREPDVYRLIVKSKLDYQPK